MKQSENCLGLHSAKTRRLPRALLKEDRLIARYVVGNSTSAETTKRPRRYSNESSWARERRYKTAMSKSSTMADISNLSSLFSEVNELPKQQTRALPTNTEAKTRANSYNRTTERPQRYNDALCHHKISRIVYNPTYGDVTPGCSKNHPPLRPFVWGPCDLRKLRKERLAELKAATGGPQFVRQISIATIHQKLTNDVTHKSSSMARNPIQNRASHLKDFATLRPCHPSELKVNGYSTYKLAEKCSQSQDDFARRRASSALEGNSVRVSNKSSSTHPRPPRAPPNSRCSKLLASSAASARTDLLRCRPSMQACRLAASSAGSEWADRVRSRMFKQTRKLGDVTPETSTSRTYRTLSTHHSPFFPNESISFLPSDLVDHRQDIKKRNVLGVPIFEGYSYYSAALPQNGKESLQCVTRPFKPPIRKLVKHKSRYKDDSAFDYFQALQTDIDIELPQFTKYKCQRGSVKSYVTETLPTLNGEYDSAHLARPIFEIPDDEPARFAANSIIIRKLNPVFGKPPEFNEPLLLGHLNVHVKDKVNTINPASLYKIRIADVRHYSQQGYWPAGLEKKRKQISWNSSLENTDTCFSRIPVNTK